VYTEKDKVDYLIMNRGAHYSPTVMEELEVTFKTVTQTSPTVKVIFRNTPAGHARCGDTLEDAPLKKPPDISGSDPTFKWYTFPKNNKLIREMIQKQFPQVRNPLYLESHL
jgi:hypothetical protein